MKVNLSFYVTPFAVPTSVRVSRFPPNAPPAAPDPEAGSSVLDTALSHLEEKDVVALCDKFRTAVYKAAEINPVQNEPAPRRCRVREAYDHDLLQRDLENVLTLINSVTPKTNGLGNKELFDTLGQIWDCLKKWEKPL